MNCLFYSTGAGNEKRCRRAGCTNRLFTDHSPEHCFAQCEAAVGDCRHFGPELRRVGCETCGGNVQIKIFACAINDECTLAKSLGSIACCQSCKDFTSLPPDRSQSH